VNRVLQQIIADIWHWTAPYSNIGGTLVSSYWLDEPAVLIDPLTPEAVLEWLSRRPTPPTAIVLANRHHYRNCAAINERFGCQVHVPAAGMHAFTHGEPVVPYEPGDELPGGLVAVEVGALSPDDGGLYLASARALWLADTLVRSPTDPDALIGWVPDSLMDDPEETKRGLLAAVERILSDYEFEHVLLAHGLPLIGNGRAELEQFVRDGGRAAHGAF
jgi:hypothetical protein